MLLQVDIRPLEGWELVRRMVTPSMVAAVARRPLSHPRTGRRVHPPSPTPTVIMATMEIRLLLAPANLTAVQSVAMAIMAALSMHVEWLGELVVVAVHRLLYSLLMSKLHWTGHDRVMT